MTISQQPAPARSDLTLTAPAPAEATADSRHPFRRQGYLLTAGAVTWAAAMVLFDLDPSSRTGVIGYAFGSGFFQVGVLALLWVLWQTKALGNGRIAKAALIVETVLLTFAIGSNAADGFGISDLSQPGWALLDACWPFSMFGMFLIGAAFMRSGAIQHPQQYPRLYTQLRWSVLALGLLAMLASFLVQPTVSPTLFNLHTGVAQSLAAVAGLLMCLGYLAWVMRGLEVPKVAGYLHWLAPAGRMALTNYLVQSIVCTLVFYGYGLGFFEHLPRMWQVPFALGLYTVQVLYSHWWLQRFRFGPAEWLWRSITYWKLQPMRRIAA